MCPFLRNACLHRCSKPPPRVLLEDGALRPFWMSAPRLPPTGCTIQPVLVPCLPFQAFSQGFLRGSAGQSQVPQLFERRRTPLWPAAVSLKRWECRRRDGLGHDARAPVSLPSCVRPDVQPAPTERYDVALNSCICPHCCLKLTRVSCAFLSFFPNRSTISVLHFSRSPKLPGEDESD